MNKVVVMVLPLLLGAGAAVGAYIWGKKQGEVTALKEVTTNEPQVSKVIKSVNSLILTIVIVAAIVFAIKKFGK